MEKGRWSAVVWLIKRLVEKFAVRHEEDSGFAAANAMWNIGRSLEAATDGRVGGRAEALALDFPLNDASSARVAKASLDELTAGRTADFASLEKMQHNALGQIWRTLGAMTKVCAGGDIRAEVLEIIAYLHHKEVMPVSIYHSEPHPDPSAVQQPPLLSLLSSRILTSLSDAAWRAHEKLVVEEAKANDARYLGLRPEVPGSVYRVRVAGLRIEVWMELILWSCLHGGWADQGAEILNMISYDSSWTAVSWREYARSIHSGNRFDESWEYAFKTRASSSMDAPQGEQLQVERTVSAEVVNAYVDAVACTVHTGQTDPELTIASTHKLLRRLKSLLTRSKSQLSISTGSWDALILRSLDAQGVKFEANAMVSDMLVSLSPGLDQGLERKNTQDLPSYVLDGGMAMQGILHRVLYGQIASGNYEAAVAAFSRIQNRADRDKRTSLESFIGQGQPLRPLSEDDLFTSNLPGIEYPAFDVQIPTSILGSFLDLVTKAEDWHLGRWLLHNEDVDGPLIRSEMYHDPFLEPAVIRYAVESNDKGLLAKFKDRNLRPESLRAIFDTQIEAKHWDAAIKILKLLYERRKSWNMTNLARVARVMLKELAMLATGDIGAAREFEAVKRVFCDMCSGRYLSHKRMTDAHALNVRNLLVVLAAVREPLAEICLEIMSPTKRRYDWFSLNKTDFNIVLSGVVDVHGSAAGRRLLEVFWPRSARSVTDSAARMSRTRGHLARVPGGRPDPLDSIERNRIAVRVHEGAIDEQELVVYGGLIPNSETILIILWKALTEVGSKQQDNAHSAGHSAITAAGDDDDGAVLTSKSMVAWGIRRLAELPYVDISVLEQIDGFLAAHEMHDLRAHLSEIVHDAKRDIVAEFEEENQIPHSSEVDGH